MPLPASKDIAPPINLYSLQQNGGKDVQAPTTDANGIPTLTSFFFFRSKKRSSQGTFVKPTVALSW
jgi:hypothetical protein